MPGWKVLSLIATASLLMSSIASAQDPSVQEHIQALHADDVDGQVQAARALGALGDEAAPAVPALIAALGSDDARRA